MKVIKSLSELFDKKYNTIACDIYGVLHDGHESYPYTVQTLDQLQKANQKVVLLSNSSRMYPALSQHLDDKFNISSNTYDDILSSGKLTRLFLEDCQAHLNTLDGTSTTRPSEPPVASCHASLCSISEKDQQRTSRRITGMEFCNTHHFQPLNNKKIRFFMAGDVNYLLPLYHDLSHFEPTEDCWQDIDFVLLGTVKRLYGDIDVDPFDETSVKNHYTPFLQACLARHVPVICANPDVVAPAGVNPEDGSQRLLICPGYIGELYEKLGGQVLYFGKPFNSIYDYLVDTTASGQEQQDQCQAPAAERQILCVGDNVATDVLGANDAGLDVVLILGGVHATTFPSFTNLESDENLQQRILTQVRDLCREAGTGEPTYVMPYLRYD
ncbi:HAD-like domain-containing protein [Absidia repens]|uniref:HAD-like domain-containing protein n=1 Tax=Absidia repens TaxID=90262 RepID=A0A1X2IN73_9FUNG|nr:HAD-like domain-containing protein [Absidia repens]